MSSLPKPLPVPLFPPSSGPRGLLPRRRTLHRGPFLLLPLPQRLSRVPLQDHPPLRRRLRRPLRPGRRRILRPGRCRLGGEGGGGRRRVSVKSISPITMSFIYFYLFISASRIIAATGCRR